VFEKVCSKFVWARIRIWAKILITESREIKGKEWKRDERKKKGIQYM
jgi:hypothetical protein